MKLVYSNSKVEEQCTSFKAAKKLFGGDEFLVERLLSRINSLKSAKTIKDIIVQPSFRFHNLENKGKKQFKGYFGIDLKTHKEKWRIILQPLNGEEKPYNPCNIDVISDQVQIVKIMEVSKHYE